MGKQRKDKSRKYYEYLKTKGVDVAPTYESFVGTLQDDVKREKYYNYLKSQDVDVAPSLTSFTTTLLEKKNLVGSSESESPSQSQGEVSRSVGDTTLAQDLGVSEEELGRVDQVDVQASSPEGSEKQVQVEREFEQVEPQQIETTGINKTIAPSREVLPPYATTKASIDYYNSQIERDYTKAITDNISSIDKLSAELEQMGEPQTEEEATQYNQLANSYNELAKERFDLEKEKRQIEYDKYLKELAAEKQGQRLAIETLPFGVKMGLQLSGGIKQKMQTLGGTALSWAAASKAPTQEEIDQAEGVYKEALQNKRAQMVDEKQQLMDWAKNMYEGSEKTAVEYGLIRNLQEVDDPIALLDFAVNSIAETAVDIPLALTTFGGSSYVQTYGNMYYSAMNNLANEKGVSMDELIESGDEDVDRLTLGTASAIVAGLDLVGAKGVLGKSVKVPFVDKALKQNALKQAWYKRALGSTATEVVTEEAQEVIEAGAEEAAIGKEFMEGVSNLTVDDYLNIAAKTAFGAGAMSGVTAYTEQGQLTDGFLETLTKAGENDFTYKAVVSNIMANKASGVLTNEQAESRLQDLANDIEANKKIPENITGENRVEAIGLQKRYDDLKEAQKQASDAFKGLYQEDIKNTEEKLLSLIQNEKVQQEDQELREQEGEVNQEQTEEEPIRAQEQDGLDVIDSPFVKVDEGVKSYDGMFSKNKSQGSSATDPLQDDVGGKRGYFYFYKDQEAEVVMMSPDEYLSTVESNMPSGSQKSNVTEKKKQRIKKGVESGDKIDMPYLDYRGGRFSQEGRNRAVVAKERGEASIPVLILRDVNNQQKASKIYDIIKEAEEATNFGTKKQIDDYLKNIYHRDAMNAIRNSEAYKNLEEDALQQIQGETEEGVLRDKRAQEQDGLDVEKASSIMTKVEEINKEKPYLNCEGFCNKIIGDKSFKDEFEKLPDNYKQGQNIYQDDKSIKELEDALEVGDIVAFGERENPRHYAVYMGDGNMVEVEKWGDTPQEKTLSQNIEEYEAVADVYREKPTKQEQNALQQIQRETEGVDVREQAETSEEVVGEVQEQEGQVKKEEERIRQEEQTRVLEEFDAVEDNETVTITSKTLEEIPEQFRDRAEKVEGVEVETKKTFLGIPYGKAESATVGDGYRYNATGEEIRNAINQEEQTIVADEKASIKEPVLEKPQDGGVQKEGEQESAELRTEKEASIEKVNEAMRISREKASADKTFKKRIKDATDMFVKRFIDSASPIKSLMDKSGLSRVTDRLVTTKGASGRAKAKFKEIDDKIYSDLSKSENEALDDIIQVRRIKAIEENRKKRGLKPIKHPNNITLEDANSWLTERAKDSDFEALNERADMYFDEFRSMLREAKKDGLVSQETLDQLIEVDYQPRKFIQYLIQDDVVDPQKVQKIANEYGLSESMIKSLNEGSADGLVTDSRWLLASAMNSLSRRRAFNEVNKTLAKELPKVLSRYNELKKKPNKSKAEIKELKNLEEINKNFKEAKPIRLADGTIKKTKEGKIMYPKKPKGFSTLHYYENGDQKRVYVSPEVYEQWYDTKQGIMSPKMRRFVATAFGSRLLKAMATGINPFFAITNFPRDFGHIIMSTDIYQKNVGILIPAIANLTADFIGATRKMSGGMNNKTFSDFVEYGGMLDFMYLEGSFKNKVSIKNFVSPKAKIGAKKFFDFLTAANRYSEIGFRLAVFDKVSKEGMKEIDAKGLTGKEREQAIKDLKYSAARQAREIIDFSQAGYITRDLESALPYLNAATQGSRVAINYFRKNPVKAFGKTIEAAGILTGLTYVSSLALISALRGEDDEDKKVGEIFLETMEGVSPYVKRAYFVIPTGTKDDKGEWQYIRVAKTPQFIPFASLAEGSMQRWLASEMGRKPQDVDVIMDEVAEGFLNHSLPIDPRPSKSIKDALNRNPFAGGIIGYVTEYDLFRDRPLFYNRGKDIPEEKKGYYQKGMPEFYKAIADETGLSPAKMKFFVEKFITTPSTNPTVGMVYALANSTVSDESLSDNAKKSAEDLINSASKKVIGSTSQFNRDLRARENLEQELEKNRVGSIEQNQKIRDFAIEYGEQLFDTGDIPREVEEYIQSLPKEEQESAVNKFISYASYGDSAKKFFDIIYEPNEDNQAVLIKYEFGTSESEIEEGIMEIIRATKGKWKPSRKLMYKLFNETE